MSVINNAVDVLRVVFNSMSASDPKNRNASQNSSSKKLIAAAISGEYSYAKLGLILGLATIVGGVVLVYMALQVLPHGPQSSWG